MAKSPSRNSRNSGASDRPQATVHGSAETNPRLLSIAAILVCAIISLLFSNGAVRGQQTSSHDPFELRSAMLGMGANIGAQSPDVSLAAGRQHVIMARNTGIVLMEKASPSGTLSLVSSLLLRDFLASVTRPEDKLGDPFITVDPNDGRFFVVNAAFGPCSRPGPCDMAIQLAVSKTALPASLTATDWHFMRLDRTLERTDSGVNQTDNEGDYDKIAVFGNTVVISWQAIRHLAEGPVSPGGRIRVLDRSTLADGKQPPTWLDFVIPSSSGLRPRVAPLTDPRDRQETQRAFFDLWSAPCGNGERIPWQIGAVVGLNGAAPRLEIRDVQSPFPCSANQQGAPQPGGLPDLSVNLLGIPPVYRRGRLWVFETRPAAPDQTATALQWMELDVSAWPQVAIVQSGTFAEPGVSIYGVAASMDWYANLTVVYTRSGAGSYPSTYYTGRLATDPLGTLRPGRLLRAGTRRFTTVSGTQGARAQFIDYPATVTDPVDGSVWIAGLVPTASAPLPDRSEESDAWIGRLQVSETLGCRFCAFTNDPLTAGVTTIRALHVQELRNRVDAARLRFGLAAFAWRDPSLVGGQTFVRAIHILDLRSALAAVYQAAGRPEPSYTDQALADGMAVRALHLSEVRSRLMDIE